MTLLDNTLKYINDLTDRKRKKKVKLIKAILKPFHTINLCLRSISTFIYSEDMSIHMFAFIAFLAYLINLSLFTSRLHITSANPITIILSIVGLLLIPLLSSLLLILIIGVVGCITDFLIRLYDDYK